MSVRGLTADHAFVQSLVHTGRCAVCPLEYEDHPPHALAQKAPRVLARITEEDDGQWYRARCERCGHTERSTLLAFVAREARVHAVATGHAVLVEAL